MDNKKFWISSGLLTMGDRILALFLGFGSFLMLVRLLPEEDFGTWALFLTVATLIEQARNGLIQNAFIKFLNSTNDLSHKSNITTASLALNVILTTLSVLFLLLASPLLAWYWHNPIIESMLRYYSLTTISLIFLSQFNFLQQANLDFKGVFFSNLFRQSIFFAFVAYMYIFNQIPSLITMVNVQSIGAVIGSVTTYFFARRYFNYSRTLDWSICSKLFSYGKYVFGTNISATIFKATDQILMGNLLSNATVGAYNSAARVSNLFEVPITSIATIVFPHSTKEISGKGPSAVKELYENSVSVMVALVLPALLLVVLFPTFILKYLAGEKYIHVAVVLQLIVAQNLFLPFLRQFGTLLDALGKPHINFQTLLVNLVLNIIVNYVMISWLGITGAAIGTLMVFLLFAIFNVWYMNRYFGVSLWSIIRMIPKHYVTLMVMVAKKWKK